MKKYIILSLIAILFLLIGCAAAEDTITIKVGCKHISGAEGYSNPMFLISTTDSNGYFNIISADYLVSPEDYYKINVGDTVKLHVKSNGYCDIVNTEESKGWW
ncbi:MAG: hypothetical protein IJF83_07145 [Methanobrevibacter sp.]|nr:hypothetical protein [Methanobrevibacter sp.]